MSARQMQLCMRLMADITLSHIFQLTCLHLCVSGDAVVK